MAKPVPLPPILSGDLSAPFLGPDQQTGTARQVVNSAIGWSAFCHALGRAGPQNLANSRAHRHSVTQLMGRRR